MQCLVLHIEHDNRPHDMSVHSTKAKAEAALVEYCWYFHADVGGGSELPNKGDLLEWLAPYGEYAHLYACRPGKSIRELTPFRKEEEA